MMQHLIVKNVINLFVYFVQSIKKVEGHVFNVIHQQIQQIYYKILRIKLNVITLLIKINLIKLEMFQ